MARRAEYTLAITNPAGTTVLSDPIGAGDPATGKPGWRSISLKPRDRVVGYGEFTVSAMPDLLTAVNTPGNRVVVLREPDAGGSSLVIMSGPIEAQPYEYQAARDGSDGPGEVTVRFADDDASLSELLVYPNPAQAATGQTTTTRYTITAVNPETAIRNLVNLNAGPGALTARRVPGLVLASPVGLMPGVTVSTSFLRDTILTDALREVSRLAGGLGIGWQVTQVGAVKTFQTYAPRDLSGSVVFSRDLGNVESLTYEPTAPTCTVALVGDATAGTGRVVKERINTAAITAGWGRREVWVDGSSAQNAGELDQLGDKALADGAATYKVAVTARDTDDQRYGYAYGPGDQVSVEVAPGVFVTALVQGADIDITGDKGEDIKPIVATVAESLIPAQVAEIRKIWRAIATAAAPI